MSGELRGFCMGWVAGPSAEIELYSPGEGSDADSYQIRYTPAFHATIRPPLERRPVGPGQLDRISQRLDGLVQAMTPRSGTGDGEEAAPALARDALRRQMRMLGAQLHTFLIPRHVQLDLAEGGLFVEIGMDEDLLDFPWELLHDGHDFLCLKHALGRFVNTDRPAPPIAQRPSTRLGSVWETLSILLICVPAPQPRGETVYERLPEAEEETNDLVRILTDIDGVEPTVLMKHQATFDNVWEALSQHEYHIIHYSGHARFDDEHSHRSGLVLFDNDMTTGELKTILSRKPPALCFINGCETGKAVDQALAKKRLNIYGLARALLDTGAYLLGSRWKVNDRTAAEFAKPFYVSLIKDGKSIGKAIIDARYACQSSVPDDVFGWASYVFYGDPRVCFRPV